MSSPTSALAMYKALLRASSQFSSYNFRSYALRRTKDAFRDHRNERNPQKIQELLEQAERNLLIIRRQASIGNLYASNKLVIESLGNLPNAPPRVAVEN